MQVAADPVVAEGVKVIKPGLEKEKQEGYLQESKMTRVGEIPSLRRFLGSRVNEDSFLN